VVEFSMTTDRSTPRCHCRLTSLLVPLLLCGAAVHAGEVPLRSFAAVYEVVIDERRIGISELKLEAQGNQWRFSSIAKAEGIYALLSDRQPTTRTRFSSGAGGIRLAEILIGDVGDAPASETARFDWSRGRLEISRRNRDRRLRLDAEVYDFLTIHVLAADLMLSDRDEASVRFYRKGRLVESRLVYLGEQPLGIDRHEATARVFEQTIAGNSARLRYYYAADNPLVPLRIEKHDDDDRTVMSLTHVEWDL